MIGRETIYAALFNKVKTLAGLVTSSRRVKLWSEVPAANQPALFQQQLPESLRLNDKGVPTIHCLNVDLLLYVNVGDDPEAVPASQLNPLLDALEAILAPPPGFERQTLGNLVYDCRISGPIEIGDGLNMGPQAVAIIPVEIIVP